MAVNLFIVDQLGEIIPTMFFLCAVINIVIYIFLLIVIILGVNRVVSVNKSTKEMQLFVYKNNINVL